MFSFFISLFALIIGYLVYGKLVERIFGINAHTKTPALQHPDQVDYVPMNWKRSFLIHFLNIAGTGPIFGAIMGAYWGPSAYLWIVFGCIFAGAVHDYLSGMLSLRHDGKSIGEVVGLYLGTKTKYLMRIFSIVLLLLVGVVFITSPSDILTRMFPAIPKPVWLALIIVYYIIATVLPIDKIIGKFYPIFGASLLIMGFGLMISLFAKGYGSQIPEFSLQNVHPSGKAIFPFLFITIACGAISGFHATQSPMIARCLKNEREGRKVFYGAMITEGVVALIWATISMTFFGSIEGLSTAGSPAIVVTEVANGLMGVFGGILVILGVVACPITSGDTAFRSARLSIADALGGYQQHRLKNRFILAIPLFTIGVALCFVDFQIIWRYFAWSNQTLATIALWAGATYLAQLKKFHWIASLPATFMTSVIVCYILVAEEGFRQSYTIGLVVGILVAIGTLIWFLYQIHRPTNHSNTAEKSKTASLSSS